VAAKIFEEMREIPTVIFTFDSMHRQTNFLTDTRKEKRKKKETRNKTHVRQKKQQGTEFF
jgi:hypothetical protein|tara:strand:- start:182 stop:361 length:180 start_codon:yes stop_codon:yes gene_type:complete